MRCIKMEDLFVDKKELIDDKNADDSSEESEVGEGDDFTDIRNTVGNIPMQWYEDLAHPGYDVSGKKIIKPIKRHELEKFLEKMDNPDYWRTVFDAKTEENIVLSEDHLDIIDKIQSNKFPGAVDPYEDYIDFFTNEKMIHPVTRQPEHKRSFIPSLIEKEKVSRLVYAIKMGWLKLKKKTPEDKNQFYDIWENETVEVSKRSKAHIAAPQEKLPSHNESYNPPPEYLPTEEEALAWKEAHPDDRQTDFLPQRYDCLRKVPGYEHFMKERFERCLDLYLCSRQRRVRVQVDADYLLPKLTKPRDLQPFPTTQALIYLGHDSYVRTISVDPSGQWLVSGKGNNVIIGSYDCKLRWFDLDLSTKPYHTLRHHKRAVRQVNFHKRYPLFASASDDGTVIVCHGMVYNDLLQNPLIVPVKILRGHEVTNSLDWHFHPNQPWVFSAGADGTIRLFT